MVLVLAAAAANPYRRIRDNAPIASEIDCEGIGVNVLLRIRQDGGRLPEIVESFSDGKIVGLEDDAAHLVVLLHVDAASWAAAVSFVESRLDRLDFDWRQHASCARA